MVSPTSANVRLTAEARRSTGLSDSVGTYVLTEGRQLHLMGLTTRAPPALQVELYAWRNGGAGGKSAFGLMAMSAALPLRHLTSRRRSLRVGNEVTSSQSLLLRRFRQTPPTSAARAPHSPRLASPTPSPTPSTLHPRDRSRLDCHAGTDIGTDLKHGDQHPANILATASSTADDNLHGLLHLIRESLECGRGSLRGRHLSTKRSRRFGYR